jgi:hypothetical protein
VDAAALRAQEIAGRVDPRERSEACKTNRASTPSSKLRQTALGLPERLAEEAAYGEAVWSLSVRPALLTATRWTFMEHTSDCGASTRRRSARRRGQLSVSLWGPNGKRAQRLQCAAPRQLCPAQPRPIWPHRCACSVDGADLGEWLVALLWIGFNTRKADTQGLSAMPSVPVEVSGEAATSSRGCIEPASAEAESPPTVQATQMPILDEFQCGASIHNERWPIPTVAQVALAWLGDSR